MNIKDLNEYAMLAYRILGCVGWVFSVFCMAKYLKGGGSTYAP